MKLKRKITILFFVLIFCLLFIHISKRGKLKKEEKNEKNEENKNENCVQSCQKNNLGTSQWCNWLCNILPDDSPIKNVEYGPNEYQF
jgi:hypothetical protein